MNKNLTDKTFDGRIRGLGDLIHTTAKITGIHSVVSKIENVTKRKCGCEERRETLNRKFPFRPS